MRVRLHLVAVPVVLLGAALFALSVHLTLELAASGTFSGRRWLIVLVGGALLGICLLVAIRLTSWVLGPVHALCRAAQAIAGGDLAHRVSADQGPAGLRQLVAGFNDMAAAIEHGAAQQRNFVADASHQLRDPLTALNLRLELLAAAVPGGSDAAVELAGARREVHRLRQVVDDLLGLASERQAGAARLPVVELAGLVTDRIGAWQPLAASRGVTLVTEIDPSRARAAGSLVASAMDAVLHNAIRFSPRGARVQVRCRTVSGRAQLTVIDAGPGLRPDEFARVGERFWRSPRHQSQPGSGLGLAIVRELLEAMGGRLDFRPAHPTGLQVVMTLSAAPPAVADQRGVSPVSHDIAVRVPALPRA